MKRSEIRGAIEKINDSDFPEMPRFSVDFMDRSVSPDRNFYRYSCGKWDDINEIPEDKVEWGSSTELIEYNRYVLGKILEKCALSDEFQENSEERKLADFYLSAMNTDLLEKLRFKPIEPLLDIINNIKDRDDLITSWLLES